MSQMATTSPASVLPARSMGVIEGLLRNRYRFFSEVREGVEIPGKIRAMLLVSAGFLALFGAVIGSDHSVWQALASSVKLPLLFLVTLLVCLPTLYLATIP